MSEIIFDKLHRIFDIDPEKMGFDYLQEFAKNITRELEVKYVLIGRPISKGSKVIQTDVLVCDNELLGNFAYDLKGTPCQGVMSREQICYFPENVAETFPEDLLLAEMGIEAYCGAPIVNADQNTLGLFVLLDTKPFTDPHYYEPIVRFLSAQVSNILTRFEIQKKLTMVNQDLEIQRSRFKKSEMRYRALFNSSQDAILVLAPPNWHIISANSAAKELFKYESDKALENRSLVDLCPQKQPDDRDSSLKFKVVAELALTEEPHLCEWQLKDSEGVKFMSNIHLSRIEFEHQTYLLATIRDISKLLYLVRSRNAISNELFNYKKSLNRFFIMAETDFSGRITDINEKFCEISGYTREELIGQDHRILKSGVHSKEFFAELWDTLKAGRPWEGQVCNKSKNGNLYWVQSFMFPNFDTNNEIVGFTSVRVDITDKKKIEQELFDEKENATFASQLAAVGEISAGIAHEIANPLAIISASVSRLAKENLPAESHKKSLAKTQKSITRISKIIRGLHHLAQKSRGDELAVHDLETILMNMLEFCNEALKGKFIKLTVELPDHPIKLHCNDIKISQVVLNLINNAKDAIAETNTKERWIKVVVEDFDEEVIIKVIDSGPGIPEENKSKILKSFFTTKKIGKGTGLGLSLVNRFVKEHGGSLKLDESQPHTCFIVTLPKKHKMVA
jgi:PAS domain S-box-containing protein